MFRIYRSATSKLLSLKLLCVHGTIRVLSDDAFLVVLHKHKVSLFDCNLKLDHFAATVEFALSEGFRRSSLCRFDSTQSTCTCMYLCWDTHGSFTRCAVWYDMCVRLQEARLQVLIQLLKQREEQHNDLNMKRLDRLWSVNNSLTISNAPKHDEDITRSHQCLLEKTCIRSLSTFYKQTKDNCCDV